MFKRVDDINQVLALMDAGLLWVRRFVAGGSIRRVLEHCKWEKGVKPVSPFLYRGFQERAKAGRIRKRYLRNGTKVFRYYGNYYQFYVLLEE